MHDGVDEGLSDAPDKKICEALFWGCIVVCMRILDNKRTSRGSSDVNRNVACREQRGDFLGRSGKQET